MIGVIRSLLLPGVFCLGLLLNLSGPVAAQDPHAGPHGAMRPVEWPTLTSADVEKVIKVLPELTQVTEKHRAVHMKLAASPTPENGAAAAANMEALKTGLGELATRNGYVDAKAMQHLVETVMLTAGFINSGKTVKQIEDEMAVQQQKIEADATLQPDQRDALLRRMVIQVSLVVPSQQNVDTVRPYFQQIMAVARR